jgi:hypothetical protein
LFKDSDSLAELEVIKQDWRQLILVYRGEEEVEFLVSSNYLVWRNNGLSIVFDSFKVQCPIIVDKARPSVTEEPKRKRISTEEELQDELDKLSNNY